MSAFPSGLEYHRVSGGGNDFILLDARGQAPVMPPERLARALCRRGLSLGADGLLWVTDSDEADLALTYFNADGSRAFCGNGTLCAARWAHLHAGRPARHRIATDQGTLEMEVRGARVGMSVPPPGAVQEGISLAPAGLPDTGLLLDTGCPHLVVFCTALPDDQAFSAAAPLLRHHPALAPAGANVDFVAVQDPHRLQVRTWERGVEGETLASGTGCLAAALAAAARSLAASPVVCQVRGGAPLKVRFTRQESGFTQVSLEGEARLVARGTVGDDAFAGAG